MRLITFDNIGKLIFDNALHPKNANSLKRVTFGKSIDVNTEHCWNALSLIKLQFGKLT